MLFGTFDIQSLLAGFIIGYIVTGLLVLFIMMRTGDMTREFKEDDNGNHTAD